jgi:hypothetical protein
MTQIPNTPRLLRQEDHLNCDPGKRRRQAGERERMGLRALSEFVMEERIASLTECGVRQHLDNQVDIEAVEDESGFTA